MSRPLSWVLCLTIAGILALLLFVSRSAGEAAMPDPDAIPDRSSSAGDLELAATTPAPASASDEPERKAIASQPTLPSLGSRDLQPVFVERVQIVEASISGTVVCEEDGRPIAGAEVLVELAPFSIEIVRGRPGTGRTSANARTDGDGAFRCDGLQLGEWTVTASARDRQPRIEHVKASLEQPNVSALLALLLQRVVAVRIVDTSGQLATAESLGIDAWMADLLCVAAARTCSSPGSTFVADGRAMYRARGSGGGILSWNLEIGGGGPLCIHALRGDRVLAARELHGGEREVELLLTAQDLARDTAGCTVRLVDDVHGGPVADVLVRFLPNLGAPREVRSDFDGRATAGPLPAGAITLDVRAKGYMPLRQIVEIPLREPLVLRLGAGRRVEGIVLDLYGAPIGDVAVLVMTESEARTAQGQALEPRCTSGPDGRFAVDSLASDTYIVRAQHRLRRSPPQSPGAVDPTRVPAEPVSSQRVDLRHGDAFTVRLRVQRGAF